MVSETCPSQTDKQLTEALDEIYIQYSKINTGFKYPLWQGGYAIKKGHIYKKFK